MKSKNLFLVFVHFVDLHVELLSDVCRCTLLLDHSSVGVNDRTAIVTCAWSFTVIHLGIHASVSLLPIIIRVQIHGGFDSWLTSFLFIQIQCKVAFRLLNSDLDATGVSC